MSTNFAQNFSVWIAKKETKIEFYRYTKNRRKKLVGTYMSCFRSPKSIFPFLSHFREMPSILGFKKFIKIFKKVLEISDKKPEKLCTLPRIGLVLPVFLEVGCRPHAWPARQNLFWCIFQCWNWFHKKIFFEQFFK